MENNKTIKILAIETSCDETAAAVLSVQSPSLLREGGSRSDTEGLEFPKIRTLSSVIKSQIELHKKMGGVVPEAAARAHVKYIRPVVEKAIDNSKLIIDDMDYIAVTAGPGLLPSLLVGVEFAKALSYALNIPLIPVNHMLGHLYSPFAASPPLTIRGGRGVIFPMISLIVSGGHTMIVLMKDIKNYRVLGQTVDDAAGEAFDKVAKMIGLPYPGGPEIAMLAQTGNSNAFTFPRAMLNSDDFMFSFSGLKTAVLYQLRKDESRLTDDAYRADIAASFQQAVVDVLVEKTMRAAGKHMPKSIVLAGGVAANLHLRKSLIEAGDHRGIPVHAPELQYALDNAAMISVAGYYRALRGISVDPLTLQVNPSLDIGQI